VRTEASRLRARLSEYYLGEGKDDLVLIEVPRGAYVPVAREVGSTSATGSPPLRAGLDARVGLAVGATVVVLALAGIGWWRLQHQDAPIPIAVLPLINLNQDPASDYFPDGLTGEIIRNLCIIDGLTVRSESSSFAFKGRPQRLARLERRLKPIIWLKARCCDLDNSCGSTCSWFELATILHCGRADMTAS
jgi:hypothetical protein